ncbi:hypothetical protein OFO05_28185, partial [Escherichia coli]|nr:hypothetical protein [Escherichia coli]
RQNWINLPSLHRVTSRMYASSSATGASWCHANLTACLTLATQLPLTECQQLTNSNGAGI